MHGVGQIGVHGDGHGVHCITRGDGGGEYRVAVNVINNKNNYFLISLKL